MSCRIFAAGWLLADEHARAFAGCRRAWSSRADRRASRRRGPSRREARRRCRCARGRRGSASASRTTTNETTSGSAVASSMPRMCRRGTITSRAVRSLKSSTLRIISAGPFAMAPAFSPSLTAHSTSVSVMRASTVRALGTRRPTARPTTASGSASGTRSHSSGRRKRRARAPARSGRRRARVPTISVKVP